SLKQELGELDRIKRVVRLMGMVNVAPGFDRMPEVIDGASDFFYELFGQAGQHARTAVGMAELPHGIPVEINGEFELKRWPGKSRAAVVRAKRAAISARGRRAGPGDNHGRQMFKAKGRFSTQVSNPPLQVARSA